MAKAVGSACNMRCDYCYYLEKEDLLAPLVRKPARTIMSDELLELYIREYIYSQPENMPVTFTWHGGEALLRPRAFYERALELQKRYASNRQVENTLQTNGMLMTDDWAHFFRDNAFLIGLSLDGTEQQHDQYRRTIGGQGSFARVMRAVHIMQRVGTDFNILSTINRFNADDPLAYYHFLRGIGIRYIQFTPIVERIRSGMARYTHVEAPSPQADPNLRERSTADVELAPYSVLPNQWGEFLCTLFDEWVQSDVGEVFIQMFDSTLAGWMGVPPGVCTLARQCGHAGIIEHNGDVFSCDHYVYPRYRLGNLHETPLVEMMMSPEQLRFGALKEGALTAQCRNCTYRFACHGECPKNRFALSQDGERGHNYLCAGYYRYFDHSAPYMDYMRRMLRNGQPPSLVMQAIREGILPNPQ